jgi:hypothetical protein
MLTTTQQVLALGIAVALGACGRATLPPFENNYSLDFGTVAVGATPTRTLALTNHSSSVVTLLSIDGPTDVEFKATQGTPVSIAAGSTLEVPFTFAPAASGLKGASAAMHTDSPLAGTATVALTGQGVTACLHALPQAVDFNKVLIGNTPTVSLEVTNCGDVDLGISDSLSGTSATPFSVVFPLGWNDSSLLPPDPGANHPLRIAVTYSPSQPSYANDAASLQLYGFIAGELFASLVIPLTGFAVSPGVVITPNPIPDCAAAVGQTTQFSVTMENLSNAPIAFFYIDFQSGGPFAFAPPGSPAKKTSTSPFMLNPHSSLLLTIVFLPQSPGTFRDGLEMATDHGDNLTLPFTCHATP